LANYILQDHLGSTSVIADTAGASIATMRFYPFGGTRSSSGTMPTDRLFTGQRLDQTGLYYYLTMSHILCWTQEKKPDNIVVCWFAGKTSTEKNYQGYKG
jgi:hypothetical protein